MNRALKASSSSLEAWADEKNGRHAGLGQQAARFGQCFFSRCSAAGQLGLQLPRQRGLLVQVKALVAQPGAIDGRVLERGDAVGLVLVLGAGLARFAQLHPPPDLHAAGPCAAGAGRAHRLQEPHAALVEEVAGQQGAGRAEADHVVGIRVVEGHAIEPVDIGMGAAVDDAQRVGARDLAREAHAAAAQDAALVVQRDARAQFDQLALVQLGVVRTRFGQAVGTLVVLQGAFAGLVADAAIHRVVEQEELHHVLARAGHIVDLGLDAHLGRYHQVARWLQLGHAIDLDQAHAAAAGYRELVVVAEVRNLDAVAPGGLQNGFAHVGLDFALIDDEFHPVAFTRPGGRRASSGRAR